MMEQSQHPIFNMADFLESLPHLPGVYRMLGADESVLYVGKARDLKKRVSSYFQKTAHSPRIQRMISQIVQIQTTITRSEAEALILENNLIKALHPRYNILFRDDKSYPYIQLSSHASPRLSYFRGTLDKKQQYFGPYPNSFAVKETLNLLQKIFQLRSCEDSVFANRSRACLLHQIKRCSAPCIDAISATAYQENVREAMQFLQGKQNELLKQLNQKMQIAAQNWEFEQAARLRNQIQALAHAQATQFVSSNTSTHDVDVIACVCIDEIACVNLAMIRGGRHLGDRRLYPQHAEQQTPAQIINAFISQHYVGRSIPKHIILNHLPDEADSLQLTLSEQAEHKINFISNPQAERRIWLEMAIKNAEIGIQQQLSQQGTQQKRLAALCELLDLPSETQRIECFDVSHTMGEATVASCVVYDQQTMQPRDYRHYHINAIQAGDDYAAMRAVLTRRYSKLAEGEGKIPDLILIDGGKGQVSVAIAVMAEVGLSSIPIVGVAKGVERKAGLEQLIIAETGEMFQCKTDSPALHLIQQIRDEAHRFAITGHRARRAKTRTHSRLDDIEGIGSKRRQALILRFGSTRGVESAGIEDIMQVEGISRTLAEKIYQALHAH
jgi:excinuclease ABC subunit C